LNIGFCCATPYHLLLSLNMALNEFRDANKFLIIYDHFDNSDEIAKKCNEQKIFSEIIVVHDRNFTKWQRRKSYFLIDKRLKSFLHRYVFDEFIFFTLDFMAVSTIIKEIFKRNKSCRFSLGEDGLVTYIRDKSFNVGVSGIKIKLFLQISKKMKYLNLIHHMYLLEPQLTSYQSSLLVHKITKLDFRNKDFQRIINEIWGCYKIPKLDMLILHQPFLEDHLYEYAQVQEKCVNLVLDLCKDRKVGVKFHPREVDERKKFKSEVCLPNTVAPFEAILSSDLNDTCLISVNSTAVFTPFIIANLTPDIILLYRMTSMKNNVQLEKFVNNFSKIYSSRGGHLFVPQTVENFIEIINDHLMVKI
jgi:hypothetical protein